MLFNYIKKSESRTQCLQFQEANKGLLNEAYDVKVALEELHNLLVFKETIQKQKARISLLKGDQNPKFFRQI